MFLIFINVLYYLYMEQLKYFHLNKKMDSTCNPVDLKDKRRFHPAPICSGAVIRRMGLVKPFPFLMTFSKLYHVCRASIQNEFADAISVLSLPSGFSHIFLVNFANSW